MGLGREETGTAEQGSGFMGKWPGGPGRDWSQRRGRGGGVLPLRGKAGQAPSQTISRVASWRGWERGGESSAKGRAHWGCFASVWEAQLEELAGDPPGETQQRPTGEWALRAPQAQSAPSPECAAA